MWSFVIEHASSVVESSVVAALCREHSKFVAVSFEKTQK
jgi:hypothetical protein